MLSLVRQVPRTLVFQADEVEQAASWIRKNFHCTDHDLLETINRARPDQSILLLSPTVNPQDWCYSFVVDQPSDEILQLLINQPPPDISFSVRLLPRMILFRVTGRPENAMEQIRRDFQGRQAILEGMLLDTSDKGTAVLFTDKSLNRNISYNDIFSEFLYIDTLPPQELFRNLQWRALSYFNESLDNSDWNLVEIRIYDSHGIYDLHLERMKLVLEALEIGIVIGGGWGKDYAHILMPVKVYSLRILTFYEPRVIKKALMGLEYHREGERFVDLDLYHNKRKINWTILADERKLDRKAYSRSFREDIVQALTDEQIAQIEKIEKGILHFHRADDHRV